MMIRSAARPVCTPPTEVASRQPCAVVSNSLTARRSGTAGREHPAVAVAHHDAPAIARQFVGELLRIAGAQDLRRGLVTETPGGKGDRDQMRLQVTRRHIDNQPPDLAGTQRRQLCAEELDMPVHQKRRCAGSTRTSSAEQS